MFEFAKTESQLKEKSKNLNQKKEQDIIHPNLTGIPDTMKTRFENISGFSFDDVKVHYNSEKPAQLQALAYTQGNQVYVAPGQERHLEHELGHVVQQKQGRVSIITKTDGFNINNEEKLEREADAIYGIEKSAKQRDELVQKEPDESIVQLTKLVHSPTEKEISTYSSFPIDMKLGDSVLGEICALFTRVTLSTKHVMLVLEWHDGNDTGNIVEHLILTHESDIMKREMSKVERKELLSKDQEAGRVAATQGGFSLTRLAESTTATFEYKKLDLKQKEAAIFLLNAHNGIDYVYDSPEIAEKGEYNCITWADSIWNKF